MRPVVADTSSQQYLGLTETVSILPRLFGRTIAPEIVRAELPPGEAPDLVRAWAATSPEWLVILPPPPAIPGNLSRLDAGERAVIALAEHVDADLILMDDRDGVSAARAGGFQATGTLGLLARASDHGLIALDAAFMAPRATNFRSRRAWYDQLLARDRAKRGDETG